MKTINTPLDDRLTDEQIQEIESSGENLYNNATWMWKELGAEVHFSGYLKEIPELSDDERRKLIRIIMMSESGSIDPRISHLHILESVKNIGFRLGYCGKQKSFEDATVDIRGPYLNEANILLALNTLDRDGEAFILTGSSDEVAFVEIKITNSMADIIDETSQKTNILFEAMKLQETFFANLFGRRNQELFAFYYGGKDRDYLVEQHHGDWYSCGLWYATAPTLQKLFLIIIQLSKEDLISAIRADRDSQVKNAEPDENGHITYIFGRTNVWEEAEKSILGTLGNACKHEFLEESIIPYNGESLKELLERE